jgi:two-component system phosphate regulon sensor histidine kinase PhoR
MIGFIRRRIAVKLTLTLVGFVALSVLAAGLYLATALDRLGIEALEGRLTAAGRLLREQSLPLLISEHSTEDRHVWATRAASAAGARITLIGRDGVVLADSQLPAAALAGIENHGTRPEVAEALAGRVGRATRRSATTDVPQLYVAVPLADGDAIRGAIRLALPVTAVTSTLREIHRALLVGALVALAVAVGIGLVAARRMTRPVVEMENIARRMAEGQLDARVSVRSIDETGALGRALNAMAASLVGKITDLDEERAKATAILDAMVEGVVAVDGHDHIVTMNERARVIFGLAGRGEGQPFMEAVRNADLHALVRSSRVTGPGAVSHREVPLLVPAARTLEVNAVPLVLGGDNPGVGVVLVLYDVTDLRRLELVRTEFVANVSHELRTPLTAIQGYLETLLGGALDEREHARQFLEIAFRHTERLGRLVNDLTDLSNIELNKVPLMLEPVAIDEVIDSVLTIMRPRADAGRVTLTAAIADAVPWAHADHDRLAQILINLVDNAVKYTPEGGQVAVHATTLDARAIEISVMDTGIGIPPQDLRRITERFYRVDKARSRELGGTGLGLAIVKHLVIAQGGELAIESAEGKGTTVRFTLPRSLEDASPS